MTNLIRKLIQIKSVSGSESEIQKFIFNYLVKLGLKPAWKQGNVWVKIKGKDGAKALIFNAHVDTVVPGEIKNWFDSPWSGTIKKGKIYGLGASDEKAGVAALLMLAEKLVKNQPEVDIWLMFVVSEEVDGSGTKIALKSLPYKSYHKLAAVLVEPKSQRCFGNEPNFVEAGKAGCNLATKIFRSGFRETNNWNRYQHQGR